MARKPYKDFSCKQSSSSQITGSSALKLSPEKTLSTTSTKPTNNATILQCSYYFLFLIFYARQLGSGLINLELAPEVKEFSDLALKLVGIFSKNREEFLLLDYANVLYGNTMIPLYDTLGNQ